MRVKAPSDVVEYIREKFTLSMGKVIKHDGTVSSFTIINKRNYSLSYIKDVLEGKDPDLSVLFDIKDGFTISDNGNLLMNVAFSDVQNIEELNNKLKNICGVVETSLFTTVITKIIVASESGLKTISRI